MKVYQKKRTYVRAFKPKYTFKRKSFKKLLAANEQAQHATLNYSGNTLHQDQYLFNPAAQIAQGTNIGGRIGDSVYLEVLRLNWHFFTPATNTGAYSYRVIVAMAPNQYTTTNATYTTGFTSGTPLGDWALPNQFGDSSTFFTSGKSVNKLLDVVIDMNCPTTTTACGKTVKLDIPLKKEFRYASTGSYGKNQNLYVLFVPYVSGGTTNTTNTGLYSVNADLIFKNI